MMESNKTENDITDNGRRDFLKLAGTVVGAVALTQAASLVTSANASDGNDAEDGPKWAMSIDINKCIGCQYCTYACQAVNNLDDDMVYCVVTEETLKNGESYFLSRPCMHCDEAPCTHVCPVGATYKRGDGIVMMDYDLCIGCRYCQVACPYQARVFNWKEPIDISPKSPTFGIQEVPNRPRGVVEKCTFCVHRIDPGVERGMIPGVDPMATPACVVACPTGARAFGDVRDDQSPISQVLAASKTIIRLRDEELSTAPSVYYVPPDEHILNIFTKE